MFADAQRVSTVAIASGGTGYKVGDLVWPSDGTPLWRSQSHGGSSVALLRASAVDGSGSVTALAFNSFGGYTVSPLASANALTGGNGSGLTVNFTFALYWRNEAWVALEGKDLTQVISLASLQSADENTDNPNLPPETDFDPAGVKRSDQAVANAINDIRGAIKAGGRFPLSVTANSVPPSATSHVLNLAAYALVGAKPDLAAKLLLDPTGGESPMVRFYKEARDWVKRVKAGEAVEYPADPDPSWQPAVRVGFINCPADLNTYGQTMQLTNVPVSLGAL